jgi:hypothetical protein
MKPPLGRAASRSLTGFLAAAMIPLAPAGEWQQESFRKIPPHRITHENGRLHISVRKSASPLIHRFTNPGLFGGFRIEGEFSSLPRFQNPSAQGKKGYDDFALRVGFIVPGDKKLSGVKKLLAPDWVRRLHEGVPDGSGVDRVHFFNLVQSPELVGKSRKHPASDLIVEDFTELLKKPGAFVFEHKFSQPLRAAALWLSSDGDDTGSDFDLIITKVIVHGIGSELAEFQGAHEGADRFESLR